MPQLPLDTEDDGIIPRRFSFFSKVALVMTALHLKERWDDYRRVSTSGAGPGEAPPSYADEDTELDSSNSLNPNWRPLSTAIRRPVRPKRACCMCCGINCSLLWKAIGIVVLISVVWNGFKLIRWIVTPAPTGLESMPAYDVSLPCSSAPFIYQDTTITKSIAVNTTSSDHTFDIAGSALGTLILASGAPDAEDVIVKMTLRTDNRALLSGVSFDTSSSNPSILSLTTPTDISNSCMRYDMTLFIPSNLKQLTIDMKSVTQLKIDPETNNFHYLDSVTIRSHSTDTRSMILPTVALRASTMLLQATGGWIVGDVSVGMTITEIDTTRGNAVTNLHAYPGRSPALIVIPAKLKTDSGSGRTDIIYTATDPPSGLHARRPIISTHTGHTKSEMYLTYKDAKFEGLVDIKSPSYSARNLQTMAKDAHKAGDATHWHGNMEGPDRIKIIGGNDGWVGVYF